MKVRDKIIRIAWLYLTILIAVRTIATAQDISFFHLSKKEGLSDNQVSAVTLDQNGLLWVGTPDGLNRYDGYQVKQFYKEDYPTLQNSNIRRMACDEKNRLWIQFADKRMAMLDENRQFHAITIKDSGHKIIMEYLLPYTSRGILFLHGSQLYAPDKKNPLHIVRVEWKEDSALNHTFLRINLWDKDKLVCSGQNRFCLFDVTNLKVLYNLTIPDILAAVRLNDNEALITTGNDNKLCRLNLLQGKIVKVYGHLKDQYGDEMHAFPRSIYHLQGSKFIFTSAYAGIYVFDAEKETLIRYKHDPVDSRSVSANNTNYIFSDTSGYFFITSNSAGLNYFNVNHYLAKQQAFFRDEQTGKVFDGYVNAIKEDKKGHIWLGTQNNLIEWNRENHKINLRQYGKINGQALAGSEEVRALCFDKNNRLWVGLNRFGVVVMNEKNKVIKYLNTYRKDQQLLSNLIFDIREAPDGKIWIATSKGLNIVDSHTLRTMQPGSNPITKTLKKISCNVIWFRNKTEAWVGTTLGAYKINTIAKTITHYDKKNSSKHDNVFCITDDKEGNIYVGTDAGMYVMKEGKVIKSYNRSNGLRSNICDGFLKDDSGRILIGNDNALLCYEPVSGRFEVYDEGSGLSDAGFRPFACFKNNKGELFWGGERGVSYFYPEQLRQQQLPLNVYTHTVTMNDTTYWVGNSRTFRLPYGKNTVGFAFSAIDLLRSRNIIYRYLLEGADSTWRTTRTLNKVFYNKLSPCQYNFRVMASRDGRRWVTAKQSIRFVILTPWWHTWWFYVACILMLVAITYFIFRYKKGQQEEREIQKMLDYFAHSGYEHSGVNEILWDITRNCISRMGFENCVIYLLDEERKVLQQMAAYGPKQLDKENIYNPIQIPLGKGIVGSVAQSAKPELISDTRIDKRYIVDDAVRLSELAVPIIHNETVIGVIDSENKKKRFFTQKHLQALQSIASLCSAKISRAMAMEAMKKSEQELQELHRRMTESKFMNLRLQMNPHFLFNTLNSIQHLIVSGRSLQAYKYLNIFSNLLRAILQHAEENFVSLEEELSMLKMYLDLESLRFKDSFQYTLDVEEELIQEEIQIPPLLIQPFAENAIWHGLLHQEGNKKLDIRFSDGDDFLCCTIEDNGIGRKQAAAIRRQQFASANHVSKGIQIVRDRLNLLKKETGKQADLKIEDLYNKNKRPCGTRVIIRIPYYNPVEM